VVEPLPVVEKKERKPRQTKKKISTTPVELETQPEMK
jgi:hypothetical protein